MQVKPGLQWGRDQKIKRPESREMAARKVTQDRRMKGLELNVQDLFYFLFVPSVGVGGGVCQ